MFKIEEYLDNLEIVHEGPSDELINRTMLEVSKTRPIRDEKKFFNFALPTLIVVTSIVLLFMITSMRFPSNIVSYAYYSIDINPSIGLSVDESEKVIEVIAHNKDAEEMIKELDLIGLDSKYAIEVLVKEAEDQGYIDDKNQFILVGRFGEDNDEVAEELQRFFEEYIDKLATVIYVSGTLEDKEEAAKLNVSPGILELSELVSKNLPEEDDNLQDVLNNKDTELESKFEAPIIALSADKLSVTFDKLDFESISYFGQVKYSLIMSEETITFDSNYELNNYKVVYSTTTQPSIIDILEPKSNMNYALLVTYEGGIKKLSNVINVKRSTSNLTVKGSTVANLLSINWTRDDNIDFDGYKVVYSKTNENPKYPDDTVIKYITDRNTTSININPNEYQMVEGKAYYFSVTYLYTNSDIYVGNSVKLEVPTSQVEYNHTDITSSTSYNKKVNLIWDEVDENNFSAYKVMYSFVDSTPVFEESGSYYYSSITDYTSTSISVDLEKIISKNTTSSEFIYFSITTLYDNQSIKKSGNAVKVTLPESLLQEDEVAVGTNITSKSLNGNKLTINWNKLDLSILEGYKVVYSFTDSTPVYDESGTRSTQWITDKNTTSATINLESIIQYNTTNSDKIYVSITSIYDDFNTKKPGNVITITLPDGLTSDVDEAISTNIQSHNLDGNTLNLSWDKIELSSLDGYKVVYSFTDSTPVYGESGTYYYQWITNSSTTSTSINLESIISKNTSSSSKVYVSITALYSNGTKKAGNTIQVTLPDSLTEEPEVQISTDITSHSLDGNILSLSWNKIGLSSLDGYKVVYSFTDSTPVYDESGTHTAHWFEGGNTTSTTINLESINANNTTNSDTVYVSVTAIYSNFSVKKAGNVKTIAFPSGLIEEPEVPISTDITSHSLDGNTLSLSWNKIELSSLDGYKVVYSFTDSTPVYDESGTHTAHWFEGGNTTSTTINLESINANNTTNSDTVYVSVTSIYNNFSVKKAGNVKAITLPSGLIEEPEVPISTDITSLVVDGNNINLTWNRIDLTSLEGYKVVYSFTDTTPVYGESGTYYSHWITDSYTTSATITLDSIIGNNTGNSTELYISITALYDNHNTKKPGNVKTISLN